MSILDRYTRILIPFKTKIGMYSLIFALVGVVALLAANATISPNAKNSEAEAYASSQNTTTVVDSTASSGVYVQFDGQTQGTTYYISTTGSDSNSGTSPTSSWRSLSPVNAKVFTAGDSILFEGGKTFSGSLFFDECGQSNQRITISSYGSGRATIQAPLDSSGIKVYNCGGYTISNLILSGDSASTNLGTGLEFVTDTTSPTVYRGVSITGTDIYGFSGHGIAFTSFSGAQTTGYADVTISNNTVHDNRWDGIVTWGTQRTSAAQDLKFSNFMVSDNKTYNNPGSSAITWIHSGSGIVLSQIKDSIIERNESYGNGGNNQNYGGGPVGIWVYDCNNMLIQNNSSHHNKTGNDVDGGGFDIDGGCSNTTFQYNYSYENYGAGYLIAQYDNMPIPMTNNTIRYNITVNDARNSTTNGAINLWRSSAPNTAPVSNQYIYNNSIYITNSPHVGREAAVTHEYGAGFENSYIANNIFYVNNADVYRQGMTSAVRFVQNLYYSTDGILSFKHLWQDYNGLAAWRSVSGNEVFNGQNTAVIGDPKYVGAGSLMAADYRLGATSPAVNQAVDMIAIFGQSGSKDYFGTTTPKGGRNDIGAHEL